MAISMLKIRRPLGRLIFNMGIAIPGKTVFLIETAPWFQCQYILAAIETRKCVGYNIQCQVIDIVNLPYHDLTLNEATANNENTAYKSMKDIFICYMIQNIARLYHCMCYFDCSEDRPLQFVYQLPCPWMIWCDSLHSKTKQNTSNQV